MKISLPRYGSKSDPEPALPHSISPPCPLCQHAHVAVYFRNCRNRRAGVPGSFDLLRCAACGLVFLFPRPSPETLAALYATDYHSHVPAAGLRGHLLRLVKAFCLLPYRCRFGHETGTLRPFGQGRLLDIGCGVGDYLVQMDQAGWPWFG